MRIIVEIPANVSLGDVNIYIQELRKNFEVDFDFSKCEIYIRQFAIQSIPKTSMRKPLSEIIEMLQTEVITIENIRLQG